MGGRLQPCSAPANARSTHPSCSLPQLLLLVAFNLIATAWLPRLQLAPGSRAGGKKGGAKKKGSKGGGSGGTDSQPLLRPLERLYLWGLVPLELAASWVLPHTALGERLPFLPLAAVSLYCTAGMQWGWARLAAMAW